MDPTTPESAASSSEGRASNAAEAMEKSAKARAEKKALDVSSGVAIEQEEDKKPFDDVRKNDLFEAFKMFPTRLDESELKVIANTTGDRINAMLQEGDPTRVVPAELDVLAGQLKLIGLKRDPEGTPEAEQIAPKVVGEWFSELTPAQQQYIVNQLDQMSEAERDNPDNGATDEEVRNLDAVAKEAEKARGDLKSTIEKEMRNAGDDEARKEKLQGIQDRADEIHSKLYTFMHPEDPGKTWLKRGGKLGGAIVLALFLGIILELHWLHNAARTK